ncbi:MAG: diguanylate cyclase/phosphodiesterase (GGDEF & EAL domains) with PAS/PAC sensor(s) [Ktedonobacterales bacterium]|jgi:predicted Zn-dependent protease|nr:MAG: diguanylate cyclase/phosphodiesterase (GGDEF & EAL domains) with PAS/PAC sensor(s) [Ktedonobacterales bacterium]
MVANERIANQSALAADTLGAAVAATPGVSDWQIDTIHDEEAQLYLIGDRTEARRDVTNERARVTLYNDHPAQAGEGQARGATTLTFLASDIAHPDLLAARLNDGVTIASLTDNPPYTLPQPAAGGYPRVETQDPALQGEMDAALATVMARLQAAVAGERNVRLSSAELYATRTSATLRNSRGISAASQGTRVMLDFVLIASAGGREAEFHGEFYRRRLADLVIEDIVRAYATFARHSLSAQTPPTVRGPVLLSGEALSNLFNPSVGLGFGGPYTFHTSAEAAYQQLSRLTPGEFVTGAEPRGDRLTVSSDPLRPFGVETHAFDGEGLPAARVTVVENGVFARRWADTRYATYLDIPPTGAFANITVRPGATPIADLRSASGGPLYEIASFSWMNPDNVSGDFVAEIKLGYRHDASGTHPIKGGSLAGNVFSAFADARLSSETYSDGVYYGPAAVRFAELTIAGA